ncbi:conserved hypothetical protein [Thiomonas sp. CB3]|nr:conserved hypothetical protein [Thiomonas sp. CB3]
MTPNDRHRSLQAKLHLAKAQLGLDDATYRAVLQRVTGKTSSTDCTVAQLAAVLNELIVKGFKPARAKTGRKPQASDAPGRISPAQVRKIEALLSAKGSLQGSPVSWAYADALAQRLCGVQTVQWLTAAQAWKVISALQYDSHRALKKALAQEAATADRPTPEQDIALNTALAEWSALVGVQPGQAALDALAYSLLREESARRLTRAEADTLLAHLRERVAALKATA